MMFVAIVFGGAARSPAVLPTRSIAVLLLFRPKTEVFGMFAFKRQENPCRTGFAFISQTNQPWWNQQSYQ